MKFTKTGGEIKEATAGAGCSFDPPLHGLDTQFLELVYTFAYLCTFFGGLWQE